MHGTDLILTITSGLTAALVFGYVTQRIGLSPIVGYLLAGVLVGPFTPGVTANAEIAEQLAEVGVILLMFGVGLQFHVEELLAVRRIALPGAVLQSAAATLLGGAIAHALGWSWAASLVYGLTLAVASTVVLIRVLSDANDLRTPVGHVAVGWLVVEDIFTVVVLVLLPALFRGEQSASSIAIALGLTIIRVGGLVAFTAIVGKRAIPWLLDHVAFTGSRELFTLTVLVLALGIAVASTAVFGVSLALGAFLAGLVVGRSDYSLRAASDALPMRDAFAVLFFVSVGMLVNPSALLEQPVLVGATLFVVVVGKPLVALAVVLIMRYPVRTGLAVAMALAQIGEFSFILANLGRDLGLLTSDAINAIVAVAIISIVINPPLYRMVDPLERWLRTKPTLWRWLTIAGTPRDLIDTPSHREAPPGRRAIIVGYGPTGRTLVRLLQANDVTPIVIEMNVETVRELRREGIAAVYGQATHQETLEAAGVREAGALILTSAGMTSVSESIRIARDLNPMIQVLARTAYLRERPGLLKAGADRVYSGEGEVALALAGEVLSRLGATAEQIARERDNVHADLLA